jgi:hypothetical protein
MRLQNQWRRKKGKDTGDFETRMRAFYHAKVVALSECREKVRVEFQRKEDGTRIYSY